jgi:hypothetical protein
MKTVKLILDEITIEVPEADKEWFIKEKGAKEVKEKKEK